MTFCVSCSLVHLHDVRQKSTGTVLNTFPIVKITARVTQNTLVIRKTLQAAISTFHTGVPVLVITFGAHIFREVAFVGEEGEGFRTTGALVLVFFTRLTHVVALLTDSVFRTL